ncbi:MAG: 1-deoxy-D-xylulose-5-phosphate reductoisomerase [Planctomycetota bacterium]|jgi:1-deoxy-D-xylulose-5-phosphate reductoisomerase|nr:1-deoxy-D-xylulose-5-phosphate reductoisomerase [Planctomycetota bacterium]
MSGPWRNAAVTILGSTGSIGCSTLDVVDRLDMPIYALTAWRSVDALAAQVRKYRPQVAVIADEACYAALQQALADHSGTELRAGAAALSEVAADAACGAVVTAVVGAAGLPATLAAVEAGKRVCIANKEPLVMAGELIMAAAKQHGATILPIDSEHSAIFQCLDGHSGSEVERLIITGSGGPFRTVADLSSVTVEQALKHPNWSMGPKITIDSATLMNKSLEIIEARWLFDLPLSQIDLLIHPQSVIHSMVHYRDGSVMAQLGMPDMRTPIQYALTWPEHVTGPVAAPDFTAQNFTFEAPDRKRFPLVDLGYAAAEAGGLAPAVMNAANEVIVERFLDGGCRFVDIFSCVEQAVAKHETCAHPSLEAIVAADAETRARLSAAL